MSSLSMSTIRQRLSAFDISGLGIPFLVLMIMAMLVVPLPAVLLDILFTFNILVSVVVIMIAIGTKKPLDFSSFPSVLLFATMLRLALNVASTRVIHKNKQKNGAMRFRKKPISLAPWTVPLNSYPAMP